MRQKFMAITKYSAISSLCLFSAIFLIISLMQAASQEDVKKELGEAAVAIGEYGADQKDKAIAEGKELMRKLDKSMDDTEASVKENWHSLGESAKHNYELSKKEFKEQRKELAGWLDKMHSSTADSWEETKKGFANAHDSLSSSWKKATEKMTQD